MKREYTKKEYKNVQLIEVLIMFCSYAFWEDLITNIGIKKQLLTSNLFFMGLTHTENWTGQQNDIFH
jgi:hypothetical protein